MDTTTYIKKRSFELKHISEEEGLILRTLLNINEIGIKERLECDDLYWNGELTYEEAFKIGKELVKKILTMVDGKETR